MDGPPSTLPISVVVCTKDRPGELAACLAALAQQTRLPRELVVVDAGTPPARPQVGAFAEAVGSACAVVHLESEPGLPRQRNVGARRATGEVVLYLDDDTVLEARYLEEIWAVYATDDEHLVAGVGGALVPDPTPVESTAKRAFRRFFLLPGHGAGRVKRSGCPEYVFSPRRRLEVEFLSGCNMSFRREVLADAAFDERLTGYALGEDLHFSYRVSRRGKLVLTPRARLDHREAGGGRPCGAERAEMAVLNRFLFVREQLPRGLVTWLCFAWSALGELLWTLRHPGEGRLVGRLRGYAGILATGMRATGGPPRPVPPDLARTPAQRTRPARADAAATAPLVTVVVPARDEEGFIGACLDSLLAQTYPAERCEILVVDNRSRDRTPEIVERYALRDPRVRLLRCEGANQAAAMNLGVREARGEVLARVDAHGWVAPDYLSTVVALLERDAGVVAVGGPYLPTGDKLLERVTALARSSRIGVGGGWYSDKDAAEHLVRTVGCPAYRRDAIVAAGMFDPAMAYGEDDELHWRMLKQGGRILFSPGLRQYNRPRATLRALARQYWNYGRGRLRVLRKHPDFLQPRHLVPSAFVAVLLVLLAGALVLPAARPALLAL
ncbi:MAG: glycosyltransferase, partial [Thermodesulfobacteriota bacterium]